MLDKLERKLGRYAIPHLMRYIVFGNALVYLVSLAYPNIVYYLNLQPAAVLHGQVWRILTFVLVPSSSGIFMMLLSLFCYYWIGEALERTIGSFQFCCFYLFGWLAILLVTFVLYFLGSNLLSSVSEQMAFFNQTLFIALATLHPDMQILLFYFIPLKAKWAGIFSAAIILVEFFMNSLPMKLLILASFVPYLIYFLPQVIANMKARKRRKDFQQKTQSFGGFSGQYYRGPGNTGNARSAGAASRMGRAAGGNASGSTQTDRNIKKVAFHHCAVCGITELDDPNMTFRYCSQCNGNYEYCEQHIHNHTHVE